MPLCVVSLRKVDRLLLIHRLLHKVLLLLLPSAQLRACTTAHVRNNPLGVGWKPGPTRLIFYSPSDQIPGRTAPLSWGT